MAQDVMQTLLTLLAGVGLTSMPKLLKGLGGGGLPMLGVGDAAGRPDPSTPSAPPTMPGEGAPDLASVLQMLSGQPAGPPQPPAPPVPRFPAARSPQPVMPRVANLDSRLGL
jgi:hypothetical protein